MKKSNRSLPVGALLCLIVVLPCFGQAELRDLAPGEKEKLLARRAAPPDVSGIPDDAVRTPSGLAYRLLEPGAGDPPPGPNDLVTVHFSGWSTTGDLLESSYSRNSPWKFQVNRAAPGVAEALQKVDVGGRIRVWLTPDLAEFQGERPDGMRVYDLELVNCERAPGTPKDLASVPADTELLDNGDAYRVMVAGRGHQSPTDEDRVLVNYTVWSPDGKISVSSARRGKPEVLVMTNVDPAAADALKTMVAGERRQIWTRADRKSTFGSGAGDFVWDLELIAVLGPPRTPSDVAKIPRDAVRTDSGLAYKVIHEGNGRVRPKGDDTVVIYYATWTTDGELVDSSFDIGRPLALNLAGENTPVGFTEALQMMVVGEKRLVWIPSELGFNGAGNVPGGMLVFEVDLLKIEG